MKQKTIVKKQTETGQRGATGYVWISVRDKLPKPNYLCVMCHYNGHREVGYFKKGNWFEQSNSFETKDIKIDREFWPDFWFKILDAPDT